MAHVPRQTPAPKGGKKAKKARRARSTPIEDVVTFSVPQKVLVEPFPIEVPLDGIARRKPHIVFEPETEEEGTFEDVVTFPVPRKRLYASFTIEVDPDNLRRRTPNPVFEPDTEED